MKREKRKAWICYTAITEWGDTRHGLWKSRGLLEGYIKRKYPRAWSTYRVAKLKVTLMSVTEHKPAKRRTSRGK